MSDIPNMKGFHEDKKIVICKHCGKYEYWGKMIWLSGKCMCRDCYKAEWESNSGKVYIWNDLDGDRHTRKEYEVQEGVENA